MEEDSPFFLSFADALTCVLGSAIALFLIFVALVKVSPLDTAVSSTSLTERVNFALGVQETGGQVDAILRVVGRKCGPLKGLDTVPAARESWTLSYDSDADQNGCVRNFRFDASDTLRGFYLRSDGKALQGFVAASLQIGGVTVTPAVGVRLATGTCKARGTVAEMLTVAPFFRCVER